MTALHRCGYTIQSREGELGHCGQLLCCLERDRRELSSTVPAPEAHLTSLSQRHRYSLDLIHRGVRSGERPRRTRLPAKIDRHGE